MKDNDLVFVDIEATGLNVYEHEIIEIGVLRVRQAWAGNIPTFTEIFEWSVKINPEHIGNANPASLKINGYIPSEWKDAMPLSDALKEFSEKTEGAIMVAHNVAFDASFLDFNLAKLRIPNKMHFYRIDTFSMAAATLKNTEDINRYSLGELCKYYNITNERPHSGMSDARADFELFKKLLAQP